MDLALHRSPDDLESPKTSTSTVGVLEPWPHQSCAVILGQSGFVDQFTVTFGPDGFAIEPGATFVQRFGA